MQLPKDYSPKFPNRCVSCGEEGPTEQIVFGETVESPSRGVDVFAVKVPICFHCREQHERTVRLQVIVFLVNAVVVVAAAIVYWLNDPGAISWKMLILPVLLGVSPGFFYMWLHEPPVSLDVRGSSVTYSFSDPSFGADFHALNESWLDDGARYLDQRPDT